MGCGASGCLTRSNDCRNNRVQDHTPEKHVDVVVGSNIDATLRPLIVFIFGGPGSKKGLMINNLVSAFDFSYLPWESAKKDVQEDPNVSVSQLLEQTKEEILSGGKDKYLIDIIPNLNYKIINQLQEKIMYEFLSSFEAQFPISFAINLKISHDKFFDSRKVLKNDEQAANKVADEADLLKLKKRTTSYDKSIRNLLEFFNSSGRLVTVDASCGQRHLVWQKLYQVFSRLEIPLKNTINPILIFKFFTSPDANDAVYTHRINLRSEIPNINNLTVDELLEKLLSIIRRHDTTDEIVIEVMDTPLTRATNYKKKKAIEITFDDHKSSNSNLTAYMGDHQKCSNYKAVASLEDEICIFPNEVNDSICSYIAKTLAHLKRN